MTALQTYSWYYFYDYYQGLQRLELQTGPDWMDRHTANTRGPRGLEEGKGQGYIILGINSSVRQRCARSSPPRRRTRLTHKVWNWITSDRWIGDPFGLSLNCGHNRISLHHSCRYLNAAAAVHCGFSS